LETVRKGIYGSLTTDIPFETYRICWDAISPDVNFIITPHPRCQQLYIATGGSFHGWKFLPIIGKYVVDMLHNNLSEECSKRWAWDRLMPDLPRGYSPKRELKDI
jgi:sarcosine oxidase/L-pipecolate oxidase